MLEDGGFEEVILLIPLFIQTDVTELFEFSIIGVDLRHAWFCMVFGSGPISLLPVTCKIASSKVSAPSLHHFNALNIKYVHLNRITYTLKIFIIKSKPTKTHENSYT